MTRNFLIQTCTFLFLTSLFITVLYPAEAACLRKVIGGANTFSSGDSGTLDDELFVCETGDTPDTNLDGRRGDDTFLIYDGGATPRDILGDNLSDPGNDTITVFEGVTVQDISGDYDTNGGTSGNDRVTFYGTARFIFGDNVRTSTQLDTGGDDTIDVYGRVTLSIIGDGLYAENNFRDFGGNDVITVHPGATVDYILGDITRSANIGSLGGDDIISIFGTVNWAVRGDSMTTGLGGNDHIIVAYGGLVKDNVEGDSQTEDSARNGEDRIEIMGVVERDVRGDGLYGSGGSDFITIEALGEVQQNLVGDGLYTHSGTSNGAPDFITSKGKVGGDIRGDDVTGNGASDSIVVQGADGYSGSLGGVDGDVVGDYAGGNGAKDYITTTVFSQIYGSVYGDNNSRTGGNGGDDLLVIGGGVGTGSSTGNGVFGDKVDGDGGNDFIHILMTGYVDGAVVGDDVNGQGGQDIIWVDGVVTKKVIGDSASGGNVKDQIAIRQGAEVGRSVVGDGTNNSTNGGWDTINILGGLVGLDVIGDDVGGNGGNDFMAIRMNGIVNRDFVGDKAGGDGGNDTMSLINGVVKRNIIGDDASGNGGNDKINVLVAGTVQGDLIGDLVGNNKLGGDDNIFVAGRVNGRIYGDHPTKNAYAGKDSIQTSPSSVVVNGIYGDNAKGAGKNDTIKVNGKINSGGVRGDVVSGKGGNDTISIFTFGDVKGNVMGDDANGAGGNDTIVVDNNGKVTGNVWGDYSNGKGGNDIITIEGTVTGDVSGDRQKTGSPNGGNDTILVERTGHVQGNVYGDDVPGNGGDDKIDIKGRVNGNVLGDKVGGAGGNDVIRIFASATVGGNVCGKNNCTNNPGDNVTFLDENTSPDSFSSDTIIIAGQVFGNVIAGVTNGNSDDTVVVVEGAEIGGTVYAGGETDGDSFIYIENIINEEKTISEVVNSVTEKDGKVTVNGVTYTLDDVETVSGAVGQIACFGVDYRMNKASDGCSARSQSEKDAIQWHQDNPGNDGRLPGLEGCAVYPYGDALRVYEIMDGTQGQLVAEIWGDVLSDAPASNELLGATTDGNIALYHLTSGELQIECHNLVDGKTQVRVLSNLAGTITNAYDKS